MADEFQGRCPAYRLFYRSMSWSNRRVRETWLRGLIDFCQHFLLIDSSMTLL